ncbi:MAG TPA: hypothetical protein VM537_04860 [Anaerolineae bacterium]|nr:hypothetical protein [Anaerolineae bacterium]
MTSQKSEPTTSNQLTLFAAAGLASLTVLPGSVEAQQTTAISGLNIAALLPNSDPATSLAKMFLESEPPCSTRCYLTWKAWGTPARRWLFRLLPSMPRTDEIESSLWPTPTKAIADGGQTSRGGSRKNELLLTGMARMWPTPNQRDWRSGKRVDSEAEYYQLNDEVWEAEGRKCGQLNPTFVEWLMGFPRDWTKVE